MTIVPSGWVAARLSDIAKLGSGGTPQAKNPAYYGGDIPWAVIGDLNDRVVTVTAQQITTTGLNNSSTKIVSANTIMLAMYGASIGKLGLSGVPMATNQAIATIIPSPRIDVHFLFYYLMSQRQKFVAEGKGAAQPNISQTILKPWPVVFPASLSDQRRTVEIIEDHLSRLDAAAGYVSTASRRLRGLRRAALNSIFGTADQYVSLTDLVVGIEAGKSLGAATSPAGDGEWGIIKVSAMTWGDFRQGQNKAIAADRVNPKYEIRPGDLLVSRANTAEYVGASVLVGENVRPRLLLSDKSMRIQPRPGVDSTWLWRALQSPTARSQISALATGTKDSMRNISQKSLLSVQLPAVDYPAQREAVSRYSGINVGVGVLEAELARVRAHGEALRRAVLAAAFSGKLTGRNTDRDVIDELAHLPSSFSEMTVTA